MLSLLRFFRTLFLRAPLEFLVALLRLLLFLLVLILVLLLKLRDWLLWLWRTRNLFEEETEDDCGKLPESIIRRPDPAIYSQKLLMAQGLPVTWNNPDIWVAPAANPTAIEPDSYHLTDDTDYIVSVRAHNASTDAAIGVQVRLVYRPWSFNSPDLTPVETDAGGNEVIRSVDISPMGAAIAQFNWHTPKLAPGEQEHYCLQARLSHPLDINLANNMGQENTNVHSQNPGFVSPGEIATIEVPLFNVGRRAQTVRFRWDAYEIKDDDKVELTLKTAHGTPRLPLFERIAHALPTVSPPVEETRPQPPGDDDSGGVEIEAAQRTAPSARRANPIDQITFGTPKSMFQTAKTRYVGFDSLRERILGRDYSLPPGMVVTTPELETAQARLGPQETHLTKFTIQVPPDAAPGTRLPVNLVAETDDGLPIGGVTIYFDVRQ